MKVVISSGHGLKIRGARGNPVPPQLDEVDEARKVTETVAAKLRSQGVSVTTFHDDVSTTQNENLNRIVNFHNAQGPHELDSSIHFNAYDHSAHGHECLYLTQQALAATVATEVCDASGLTNRGAKKRTDLFFLNSTSAPAILVEVVFCDNTTDSNIYRDKYDAICSAIASAISGREFVPEQPPAVEQPPQPQPKPTLSRGSYGPYVVDLQQQLNEDNDADIAEDGDFGRATEEAVFAYQLSRGLDADGIVGPQTWEALDSDMPAEEVVGLPPKLGDVDQANIVQIAMNSAIADYEWEDRGRAPVGYIEGFALSYANVYRKFIIGHQPALEMAKARSGSDKDVFNEYVDEFDSLGMDNDKAGADALRHLYALLFGLGMRESSGQHCCGRDMSADNVSSDTCESGLYQTSYNAHSASKYFDQVFNEYRGGFPADNPQGFLSIFAQDVNCSQSDWSCYGSGDGYAFQQLCKKAPAFAVESCAITLRNLCNHYGPVIRHEAELRPEADEMLQAIQKYIDGQHADPGAHRSNEEKCIMAAVPVTLSNATITNQDGSTSQVQTIQGDLSITGLEVGGGPVFPPDTAPTPPGQPPKPTFPIWGPPGMELPDVPGYPPVAGHPLPQPPPSGGGNPPGGMWIPAWVPGIGWIVIPGFPVPTPSGAKKK